MLRIFNEITYSASGGITQILLFIVDRHVWVMWNVSMFYTKLKYIFLQL